MRIRRTRLGVVAAVAAAALVAPAAHAAPPPNDNRADATPVPSFPASLAGSTVDATVERLDPQISECGQIDQTVWYRIDQAPDGAITLGVQGAGLTPAMRVYRTASGGLNEIDCSTASAAGGRAQVAFQSVRGATFYVVVGRKPGTAAGTFTFDTQLALPPANDSWRNAQPLGKLPVKTSSSTLGATFDSSEPRDCGASTSSVWYSLTAKADGRIGFRLHMGDRDGVVVVQQRSRSERDTIGCTRTDKSGNAALPVDVEKGGAYLIMVSGLQAGGFVLEALQGQAPEGAPGAQLQKHAAQSIVNGLADMNDMWWTTLRRGQTYRIAFTSANGCPTVRLFSLRNTEETLGSIRCSGYREFTPGPDGGGKYVFEVRAARTTATTPYRLAVAPAGPDDLGVGVELANLTTRRGSLSMTGVDQVDRYHFDVARTADVRITLRQPVARPFLLGLATDDGGRMGWTPESVARRLLPGRYVLAVVTNHSSSAKAGGPYALSLVIRQLTTTRLTVSSTTVRPGTPLTIRAATSPLPDGGVTEVQIDRFDPWTGWQFYRLIRLSPRSSTLTWTPPAEGRWRIRASYNGNVHFSDSTAEYVTVLVASTS